MPLPPPDSGRRFASLFAAAAALLPTLLLPACGGDDRPDNRIKPIQATLSIDPVPVFPAQAVYLVKDPQDARFPDLETVQVKLYTSSAVTFDAFTLEIHFDPTVVQVGEVFEYNPGILGGCFSETACEPECMVNTRDVNSTGILKLGVAVLRGCPPTSLSTDTMLLRIGFIAQSTIDPPGSPIELFVNPDPTVRGDCEILLDVTDLEIPFEDGNATMTATR